MTNNVVDMRGQPERALPASEAAEQALLGAILVRNDAIDEVADFLAPEHFRFAGHGRIYEAAVALHRQGRKCDAITIMGATQGDEDVAAAGGDQYIAQIMAGVLSTRNAAEHGRLILDMHLRRELIGAGQSVASDAFTADLERPGTDQAEEAVRRMTAIADAATAPRSGPRPIGEAVGAMVDQLAAVAAARGEIVGASTGLVGLDRQIGGLQAPTLLVAAARPGMGKTALALNMARHVAEHHGRVIFYSLEMSRTQLLQRLVAERTGIPVDRQRAGPIHRGEFLVLQESAQEAGALALLLDDGRQRTVATMRAHARRAKRRGGLALVVVDYLQLMVGGDPRHRVAEVSQITRDLKMMALDVDVPVVALSQLSREVEKRDDKRPVLPDLRDSGSIEQDADQVMFLYREEYYLNREGAPKMRTGEQEATFLQRIDRHDQHRRAVAGLGEIIVAKNRHGRTGTVECRFDGPRQRFSDLDGAGQEELL